MVTGKKLLNSAVVRHKYGVILAEAFRVLYSDVVRLRNVGLIGEDILKNITRRWNFLRFTSGRRPVSS
jgi:hypothetical protein